MIGYVQYDRGSLTTIVNNDPMPDLPFTGVLLLERQIAVDINGDPYLDIVGVLNPHEQVMAYINPGPAGGKWARRTLASGLPNPINIASGDIDGDGDPDIAINMRVNSASSGSEPRGIVWLENPGSGNAAWTTRRITEDSYSRSLVLADIDSNGILDVVASDNQSGTVTAFIGNGGAAWTELALSNNAIHGHFGSAADIDGDGRAEIFQPKFHAIDTLFLDAATGAAVTQSLARFELEDVNLIVTSVKPGDLDGDGLTDIVFTIGSGASSADGPLRGGLYYLRQTAASWELGVLDDSQGSMVGVQVFDYDGDGDLDIVANTEYPAQAVTLYLQN